MMVLLDVLGSRQANLVVHELLVIDGPAQRFAASEGCPSYARTSRHRKRVFAVTCQGNEKYRTLTISHPSCVWN